MSKKIKGPLMYISTAQVADDLSTGQEIYDSRIPKRKKVEVINIDEEKIKKLENIVTLYQKNMPVTCQITYDDQMIEGVPSEITGNILIVHTNDITTKLDITKIKDFFILDF